MKYQATFSDGQVITRKSHRSYSHAWRIIFASGGTAKGFAASEALAHSAARSAAGNAPNAKMEVAAVESKP